MNAQRQWQEKGQTEQTRRAHTDRERAINVDNDDNDDDRDDNDYDYNDDGCKKGEEEEKTCRERSMGGGR